MSENTLKRAAEAPHVIAAKNLAEIYARMGGKRSAFLEKHAKRQGFSSWNAYRATGKTKIHLQSVSLRSAIISPDLYSADRENFRKAAGAIIKSATKAGYSCDHSAPIVISRDIETFMYLRAAADLVLRKDCVHRSFILPPEDLHADDIVELLAPKLSGIRSTIIIDLPDLTPEGLDTLLPLSKDSIILTYRKTDPAQKTYFTAMPLGKRVDLVDNQIYAAFAEEMVLHPQEKPVFDGMWAHRTLNMLSAFGRAGVPFDPRTPPSLHTLDISHPEMERFVDSIPGFSKDKLAKGQKQDSKSSEQYNFLVMNLRSQSMNVYVDDPREVKKEKPKVDTSENDVAEVKREFARVILADAQQKGASDIHISRRYEGIRFRINNVLAKYRQMADDDILPLINLLFQDSKNKSFQEGSDLRYGDLDQDSDLLPPYISRASMIHHRLKDDHMLLIRIYP